jgi:hypothetical protein
MALKERDWREYFTGGGATEKGRAEPVGLPEEDPEKLSAPDTCQKCGRLGEIHEMNLCPICEKRFCPYCKTRIAGRDYCSRACGDHFFFGGIDEEEMEKLGDGE